MTHASQQLKQLYEQELEHWQTSLREFAECHPAPAHELGIGGSQDATARLVQGMSLLAARTRRELNTSYPGIVEPILSHVCPLAIQLIPSIGMVSFRPKSNVIRSAVRIKRHALVQSKRVRGQALQFRTTREVVIYPIELVSVASKRIQQDRVQVLIEFQMLQRGSIAGIEQTGLRLHLSNVSEALNRGSAHEDSFGEWLGLGGPGRRLFWALTRGLHRIQIRARSVGGKVLWEDDIPVGKLQPVVPAAEEVLFPECMGQSPGAYHLMEYFLHPSGQCFVDLFGLEKLQTFSDLSQFSIRVDVVDVEQTLENLTTSHIRLGCTPVVNLFPEKGQLEQMHPDRYEYDIVPPRHLVGRALPYLVMRIAALDEGAQRYQDLSSYFSHRYIPLANALAPPVYKLRRELSSRRESAHQASHNPNRYERLILTFYERSGRVCPAPPTVFPVLLAYNSPSSAVLLSDPLSVPSLDIPAGVGIQEVGSRLPPLHAPAPEDLRWELMASDAMALTLDFDLNALRQLLETFHRPGAEHPAVKSRLQRLLSQVTAVTASRMEAWAGIPRSWMLGVHVEVRLHTAEAACDWYFLATALFRYGVETTTGDRCFAVSLRLGQDGAPFSLGPEQGHRPLL